MTLLGKLFTFLVLVLSVVFFVVAVAVNSSHIKQKDVAAAAKTRAVNAEQKNEQLNSEIERLRETLSIEQLARRSSLAALQTDLDLLISQLADKTDALKLKTSANTELAQSAKIATQEALALTNDNQELRSEIVAVQQKASGVLTSLVETKDRQIRLQGIHDTLLARTAQMADDHTAAISKLETLGIDENTILDGPPAVNGQVLAVNTNGQCELSVGRDDGIRVGHTLDVSRRGVYLGRVRVTTVRDDKCVTEILTGFQRGAIIQGDRVDSKLY